MSDEIRSEQDEVEAHGHHTTPVHNANDEPRDEVEAHGHHTTPVHNANDEPRDEVEENDVEAHRHNVHNRPSVHN
jgi:hypothetical protein